MSQFININSQLDALRIKEFEEKFYEKISDNVKIVPKVTPFKGINTDLLYIKDNKILFVKFMDTSEELFSILDEELIEAKKAINVLGGEIEKVDKFLLPNSDIERNIVIIKKIKNTSCKYPRKPGTATKQPII